MGSYFKGWSNTQPYIQGNRAGKSLRDLFVGHVLKVDYKRDGLATVRVVGMSKEDKDDDIKLEAYPANLNIVKYPLPGELVIVFLGSQNGTLVSDFKLSYYYITVLSTNQHLLYNSTPYIGQTVSEKAADEIFTQDYEQRFITKTENINAYMDNPADVAASIYKKKTLKPQEGDVLLQGRFGAGIRLGGTAVPSILDLQATSETEWSDSAAGSPIMILSVNSNQDKFDYEKVNQGTIRDDFAEDEVENQLDASLSTMHICATQAIPVVMSTSKELRTYTHVYDFKRVVKGLDDMTNFLQTTFKPGQLIPPGGLGSFGGFVGGNGIIVSHAGSWDGPGGVGGENQLINIQKNIAAGTHIIEIDVQFTSDGIPILFHDPDLDSKTNGKGAVNETKWADIAKVTYKDRPDNKIPKLEEACALFANYAASPSVFQLDKGPSLSKLMAIPTIKQYASRFMAKGKSWTNSDAKANGIMWQPILPDDYVTKVTSPAVVAEIVSKLSGAKYMELQFNSSDTYIINGELAKACTKAGCGLIGIAVGGTNKTNPGWGDSKEGREKIIKMGVAGVMTNKPNALKAEFAALANAAASTTT